MNRRKINLNIEELALSGFPAGQRYYIGDAIERELKRIFSERGIPARFAFSEVPTEVSLGEFAFAPGTNAETIGAEVAQTIYRRFTE
jgi:hypothetical protein